MNRLLAKIKIFMPLALLGLAILCAAAPGLVSVAQAAATSTTFSPDAPSLGFIACLSSPISCALYMVTYAMVSIGGMLISVGAWLTQYALRLGGHVFDLPAVQVGYSVSLAVANLGLVLGIIVIAIMTILRNESYGLKKILWKLVLMAILINFGLVVTRPIVNFADSLSIYFMNASAPDAPFTGGNYDAFVDRLTASFAPQSLFKTPVNNQGDPRNTAAYIKRAIANGLDMTGISALILTTPGGFSTFMSTLLNMIFVLIFILLTAFVFLALAILLFIRYLYMAFLLIILPIAWLLWVFPKLSSYTNKWWDNFIRWTFFAPISIFFLYLAILTTVNRPAFMQMDTASNLNGAGLGVVTNNVGILDGIAEKVVVLALAFGGLFVANKLSIAGAKAAIGAAQGAGKAGAAWAGRKGTRTAGWLARPSPRMAAWATTPPRGLMGRIKNVVGRNTHATQTALATSPTLARLGSAYRGPGQHQGLAKAIFGGMIYGSGIWKKKGGAKDWECQNCATLTPPLTPHIMRSSKKPTSSCPNCHATATVANWTEV